MRRYRLIMWKRRWFGMAPQRYYIVERINDEVLWANDGHYPGSWLLDLMPRAAVMATRKDYYREQRVFLWVIW